MAISDTPGVSDMESRYPLRIMYQVYSKNKEQFMRVYDKNPSWLMFAVESGRFSYEIDGIPGEASSGDIVICPPFSDCKRNVIEPLTFYYILFDLRESEMESLDALKSLLRDKFAYKYATSEKDRLFNNFRNLIRLEKRDSPENRRWRLHFISDIWLMFYLEAAMYHRRDQLAGDPLIKQARELIEKHAFEDMQIQDVAEKLDIHPVRLTRRFQHIFGISPSRYLIAIRMEKAKKMLIETEDTIEQIARQCGYENGFYFSRMFTKYSNVTPSQFRKNHTAHSP